MHISSPSEERETNSFAASMVVATVMSVGFFTAATGIIITSLSVSIAGLVILLGGVWLHGEYLE